MKNILLAVTGLSPQVITETLYAFHQNSRAVHEIHVITTREGKEIIYAELLGEKRGYYFKYLEDYNLNPMAIGFGRRNIHVITDEYGIEISDIVTETDNESLLKTCLELTFEFTKDPDTAVFFSVAGGRKTMSACLSLAAQMYGRAQDRLYHVLVSPEFESNREFYYPPVESKTIPLKDRNGQTFFKETRFATINLVHIPFVSIRERLSVDMLKTPEDPGTLMLSIVKEGVSRLTVNLISGKIICKGQEMDLQPARMALYAFFVIQKKNCKKDVKTCGSCEDCFIDIQTVFDKQEQITELYGKVSGTRPLEEMSDTGITGLNADNFNSYKSRIKENLLYRFGPYALQDLEIAAIGKRPNKRYGILMDKGKMEIVY